MQILTSPTQKKQQELSHINFEVYRMYTVQNTFMNWPDIPTSHLYILHPSYLSNNLYLQEVFPNIPAYLSIKSTH